MKKRLCYSIAVLTMAMLCFSIGAVCATSINVNPPSAMELNGVQKGDTLQVNITVTDASSLWGWSAALSWNSSILELNAIAEGSFLKNAGSTLFVAGNITEFPDGVIPELSCMFLSSSSASGSGVLSTLTFKVLEYGSTSITLSNTTLLSSETGYSTDTGHREIEHTTSNGALAISQPTASPTPSPSPSVSPSSSPSASSSPTTSTSPTASPSTSPSNSPSNSPTSTATPKNSSDSGLSFEIVALIASGVIVALLVVGAVFIQRRKR